MSNNKTIRNSVKRLKQILNNDNPENLITFNEINSEKLKTLMETIEKYYRKGSFPNGMMRKNRSVFDGVKVGNWYSIGVQPINLYPYNYKPWDNDFNKNILDWDPDKVEFVWIKRSEFNGKKDWGKTHAGVSPYRNSPFQSNDYSRYVNNTNPEILSYIPFGIELEVDTKRNRYTEHFYCDYCNEYSDTDDYDSSECEAEFEHTDLGYISCGDEHPAPGNYDEFRKASFKFLAELNLSFGAYGTKTKPVWIAKEDSTVSVEYVSHPMTYRAFKMGMAINKKLFNSFYKYREYASGWRTGTAGIHIHIDKNLLSTYQTYALLNIHYDNPELIAEIAGRSTTQQGWGYLQPVDSLAVISKEKNGIAGRSAITFTNETIELRYFRSNLKDRGLEKNIEWIQALYHFVRTLTYQDMARDNGHNIKYFLLFIKAYRNRYKNIYFHLMKFGHYKPDKNEKDIIDLLNVDLSSLTKLDESSKSYFINELERKLKDIEIANRPSTEWELDDMDSEYQEREN